MTYRRSSTGFVVIDPYNDFISEGGKVSNRLKGVAEAKGVRPAHEPGPRDGARRRHSSLLRTTPPIPARRLRELEVHRADPEGRLLTQDLRVRSVGGQLRTEFEPRPGDIGAQEHWCSSGFANTVRLGAGLGDEVMHAALKIGVPNYATAILSAEETLEAIATSTA